MPNVKYRIKDEDEFLCNVFGADSMLEHWPELLTTGVQFTFIAGLFYVSNNGKKINDTAFLTLEEFGATMEKVE